MQCIPSQGGCHQVPGLLKEISASGAMISTAESSKCLCDGAKDGKHQPWPLTSAKLVRFNPD